jgi:hypothetical protein
VRTLPPDRAVAWHAAGHVSALVVLNWPPLVCRIDTPSDTLAGSCRPDWERRDINPESMKDLLLATLAGPLVDGEAAIDAWPIDPPSWKEGNGRDAEQAAFIAHWLGIDNRVDWGWIAFQARKITRQRRFRQLVVAISRALQDREILGRDEIMQIAKEVDSAHGNANPR